MLPERIEEFKEKSMQLKPSSRSRKGGANGVSKTYERDNVSTLIDQIYLIEKGQEIENE